MEWELIKQILELGGVAVLAVIIFLMYRRDRLSSEKRLSGLLKEDHETRTEHTKVLTELITYLKLKNGNRRKKP